jgi:hypothetical protein
LATLTIAERSALSFDEGGVAGVSGAIKWTGMLAGDVMSATVPWAKVNPVIAPQVLRLTSAVACCQAGFFTECTQITSFPGPGNVPPMLS